MQWTSSFPSSAGRKVAGR